MIDAIRSRRIPGEQAQPGGRGAIPGDEELGEDGGGGHHSMGTQRQGEGGAKRGAAGKAGSSSRTNAAAFTLLAIPLLLFAAWHLEAIQHRHTPYLSQPGLSAEHPLPPAGCAPDDSETRIVSMSLFGGVGANDAGAVRNAELLPKMLPGWKLRVYANLTEVGQANPRVQAPGPRRRAPHSHPRAPHSTLLNPKPSTQVSLIPKPQTQLRPAVVDSLQRLGAEIVDAASDASLSQLPPTMWRFMAGADSSVARFVVRDADSRVNRCCARRAVHPADSAAHDPKF